MQRSNSRTARRSRQPSAGLPVHIPCSSGRPAVPDEVLDIPLPARPAVPPADALRTLTERFGDDLVIHGPGVVEERGGTLSLAYRDIHPHDLSQVLDQHGVCVRAGHHCAKPLMKVLGVNATARAPPYLYNDETDVDTLADALADAGDFFAF